MLRPHYTLGAECSERRSATGMNLKRLCRNKHPVTFGGSRIHFGERFNRGKAAGGIGNLVNNIRFSIGGD